MAILLVILLYGDIGIEFQPSKAGGCSHNFGIESSPIRSRASHPSRWSAQAHKLCFVTSYALFCDFLCHLDGKVLT